MAMIVVLLLLLFTPALIAQTSPITRNEDTRAVEGNCNYDWTWNAGMCYFFSETEATWTNAQVICNSYNATLLYIRDSKDWTFIRYEMRKGRPTSWTAGHDHGHPHIWTWSPSETPFGFTQWREAMPSNRNTPDNHCVAMEKRDGYKYKWANFQCIWEFTFVCQKPDNLKPDPGCPFQCVVQRFIDRIYNISSLLKRPSRNVRNQ